MVAQPPDPPNTIVVTVQRQLFGADFRIPKRACRLRRQHSSMTEDQTTEAMQSPLAQASGCTKREMALWGLTFKIEGIRTPISGTIR